VLLTHRDDVADADSYARHFGARVWIHRADAAAAPFATDLIGGIDGIDDVEPQEPIPGVRVIPAPGHGKWGRGDPDDLSRHLRELAPAMASHGRAGWDHRP